ncbi:unnamed protein product [marine sediment metagenome]|uniref:Uncharacterized protein n=1 Tax=marine sediment metagenome TaxID=412755 RepID=X0U7S9_9ZZZZ
MKHQLRPTPFVHMIDKLIGRHMSPFRWIVVWLGFSVVCLAVLTRSPQVKPLWAIYTFCPVGIVLGLVMAWGNARRLQ